MCHSPKDELSYRHELDRTMFAGAYIACEDRDGQTEFRCLTQTQRLRRSVAPKRGSRFRGCGIRETTVMEDLCTSIRLRAPEFDHLRPFFGFVGDEFPKLGWWKRNHGGP